MDVGRLENGHSGLSDALGDPVTITAWLTANGPVTA